MGYNVDYIGEFPFTTSFIAEAILKDLSGKDLNKIKDFPKIGGYSGRWFELELEVCKSEGENSLRWNGAEKTLITPEMLNAVNTFIQRFCHNFIWLDSEVKCVGEDGDVWYLICSGGVWKESKVSSQEIDVRNELAAAKQRIAELEKLLELNKPKPPKSRVRREHEVDSGSGHFLDYGG